MPRRVLYMVVMLIGVALCPVRGLAQATMQGIVRDDSTARPLAGVEVLLAGTSHRAVTGEDGRYHLSGLPPGRLQVLFRAVGYLPGRVEVLLESGVSTRVNQSLAPSAVQLDPIEVTGAATAGLAGSGFEERRRMGFGVFYDSEELRQLEHLKPSDLLRRKGGVQISQTAFNGPMVAMNSTSRDLEGKLDCYMSVYLDGRLFWRGGKKTLQDLALDPPPDFREFIGLTQVEAVEVYRSSAGIPVQFGGASGQCGAVVIWTRRSP